LRSCKLGEGDKSSAQRITPPTGRRLPHERGPARVGISQKGSSTRPATCGMFAGRRGSSRDR
jgi:hypothetical protein